MLTKELYKLQGSIKQIFVLVSFLFILIPDAYCSNHSAFPNIAQTEILSGKSQTQLDANTIRFIKNLRYIEDFELNLKSDFAVLMQYYESSQNIRIDHFEKKFISLQYLLVSSSTDYTSSHIFKKLLDYHN